MAFCISKISDDERGEIPLLAILKGCCDKKDLVEEIALKQLTMFGLKLASLPVLIMDDFPKTATGKIQRKKISAQFKLPPPADVKRKRIKASSVHEIFAGMFGAKSINNDPSFDSLGGTL